MKIMNYIERALRKGGIDAAAQAVAECRDIHPELARAWIERHVNIVIDRDEEDMELVKEAAKDGEIVEAVKLLRSIKDIGLREAKEYVESLED